MRESKKLISSDIKTAIDIIKTLSLFASFKTGGSFLKIVSNLLRSDKRSFSRGPSLMDISNQLILLKKKGLIEEQCGQHYFTFFKPKGQILLEKMKNTDYKINKLNSYVKLFKFIPFIKAVLVTGSVVIQGAREDSDIDLLIICRRNTIWLVRIYMTIFFDILAIRRKGKNIRDKLCLNHFIDEDNLEIKDKSVYGAFNYKSSMPFYVRDQYIWAKFIKDNLWIEDFFYEAKPTLMDVPNFYEQSVITRVIEIFARLFLWRPIYSFIKKIQIAIIKKNPLTYFKNSRIIYNDREIIFHPLPRSLEIDRIFEAIFQKACHFLKLSNE